MKRIRFLLSLVLVLLVLGICASAAETVYLDGTGNTTDAYADLKSAVEALPDEGGTVIVCGDTAMVAGSQLTLPAKSGKVTITSENGAKFKLAYSLKLGSDTEFDNIELVNANKSWGAILACGHELTMGEGVTTSIENTNNRAIAIYGGDTGSVTTDYDAHIVLKGGTWRSVYGGHHTGTFGGNSTVEVSNVTMTHKLSAKCEVGTFNGDATLIADLRGNKTVTSASYLEIPTFLVDDGYEAVLDGTTYKQVPSAQVVDTVYVDGIGTAENTYATLEEAIAALPMDGGKVIVCSDTIAVLQGATKTLPEKNGTVLIEGSDPSVKITLRGWLILSSATTFSNLTLHTDLDANIAIYANGNLLTIEENVRTVREDGARWIRLFGGTRGQDTEYDTHLVVKAGTYRDIFGGSDWQNITGSSVIELSNTAVELKVTNAGNVGGGKGYVTGTHELILDLRGGKTVSAATFAETPTTILVDEGYVATLDGTVYKQVKDTTPTTVYVDGIGTAENTYATLEEAIAALPMDGGKVIVCSDTIAVLQGATKTLPEKNGTVLIEGSDPSVKITLRGWLILGSATTFSNLTLYTDLDANIAIYANGNLLTVEENVLTARADGARWIRLFGGTRGQDTEYDTHLVVKAGTYRDIFGGSDWQNITGSSVIELSNTAVELKVTNAGNVGGGKGYVTGTHELILDLRGGKTVSAATFAETPTTILVDEGYEAVVTDKTYSQRLLHTHSYTEEVTAPTCTEQGYTTYTCACGDTYKDNYVAATGHVNTTETVVDPTCTEAGSKTVTCACGEVISTEEILATGHAYTAEVTAPTCTEQGYTTYTCECGDTYQDDFVAATGHVNTTETVVDPTCTEAGSKTVTCACGEVVSTEEIPATGHAYTAEVTAPTCTEKGYTTYTCACGDTYVDDYVDATGHVDTTETVVEATCTEAGSKTVTCACGEVISTEVIPATGHTEVVDAAVAPTCTETGLTEGKHCSVCGEVIVAQEEVAATGHDWDEGVIDPPAKPGEAGIITYTCKNGCGETKTEEVPALDVVAKIGDAKYATLADAVAAAVEGDTVTLVADVTLEKFVTIDESITLDLGGKAITRDGGAAVLYVNGADITVTITGEGSVTGNQTVWVANGTVKIMNGTFTGVGVAEAVYVSGTGHAEIYGGTFANGDGKFVLNQLDADRATSSITVYGGEFVGFNPSNNAAENAYTNFAEAGKAGVVDENGVYTLTDAVAEVKGATFATLADAVAVGGEVVLVADVTEAISITEGMDVTISGNYTITAPDGKDAFYVTGGKLTLAEGLNVVANTDCVIYIRGGEVVTSANLTSNSTGYAAIQGNGMYAGNVTINGGTVTSANELAVYWPQKTGTLTVNGGIITGTTGIYTKGNVTINGGEIIATGEAVAYNPNNNGGDSTGDALVVDNCYADAEPAVVVAGGTFISANGAAVASYANGGETVVADFIAGGNFSSDVSALCVDGFKADDEDGDGVYGIVEDTVVTGDIDGDGIVSIADVLMLVRAIVNDGTVENGDLNGDGKVGLVDAIRLMKQIAK